jgi:hypothetical protein
MMAHGWGEIQKWLVLVWVSKFFFTPSGALEFLNTLSPERAIEAKMFCMGGFPCYVVYREETAR